MKRVILPALFVLALSATAQLRLPAIINDHMVIQRETTVPLWGWAHPDQEVVITTSWDTTKVKTKTQNTAVWRASIKTPKAGGPHTITIQAGGEVRTLTDVLSGEVWLCSGQSNMEWSMEISLDGKKELAMVNDPAIRLMHIPKAGAASPQVHGEGAWRVCDKNSVQYFSAVAYYFGKKLNAELNVPIGLINASWGGSNAELWTTPESIEKDAELVVALKKQQERPWWPFEAGSIYHAMIHPIVPYAIAGTLWYQGESNTAAPATYKHLMETMINDWRKAFKKDFPFYYVQIAPYAGYGAFPSGTLIREQQVKMLEISKTGMVVISDHVDNVNDIHPGYKKPVGERLANLALADAYGVKSIAYLNPLYKSMKVEKSTIRIIFENATTLVAKNGSVTEFQLAGEDKKFYPAKAKIEGNTIVVSAKEVKKPVAVRYAWGNGSIGNLFSKEGLPVSSFRTDDWVVE
jgi:sialate O-acetylesterase